MASAFADPLRTAGLCAVTLTAFVGCSLHREEWQMSGGRSGTVFYLDGAGGASVLTDWGAGVRAGLVTAGFDGQFVNHRWQTQLGVAVDQVASRAFKRKRAAGLASTIRSQQLSHPDEPVSLIGLSAGTAVVVFTLEALPPDMAVDNVILLGSSLSARYDLTEALRRVRNRMYVFTSDRDTVLKYLVPLAGTADRERFSEAPAGLHGFRLPLNVNDETRHLYAKVVNVAWSSAFEQAGHTGGHTGAVNQRFVRRYIAPLVFQEGPRFMRAVPRLVDTQATRGVTTQPRR